MRFEINSVHTNNSRIDYWAYYLKLCECHLCIKLLTIKCPWFALKQEHGLVYLHITCAPYLGQPCFCCLIPKVDYLCTDNAKDKMPSITRKFGRDKSNHGEPR